MSARQSRAKWSPCRYRGQRRMVSSCTTATIGNASFAHHRLLLTAAIMANLTTQVIGLRRKGCCLGPAGRRQSPADARPLWGRAASEGIAETCLRQNLQPSIRTAVWQSLHGGPTYPGERSEMDRRCVGVPPAGRASALCLPAAGNRPRCCWPTMPDAVTVVPAHADLNRSIAEQQRRGR